MLPSSWDLTPCSLAASPLWERRLGVFGPYLFHIISHHPLLGSLSAHEGFQLPQTPHTLLPASRPCTEAGPTAQDMLAPDPHLFGPLSSLQASAQMSAFQASPRQPLSR